MDLLTLVKQATQAPFPLASRDVKRGDEYQGPCPFCKAGKNRFHVWSNVPAGRDNYWCRVCEVGGDDITFCREYFQDTFWTACSRLSCAPLINENEPTEAAPIAPRACDPPPPQWQEQALAWLERCEVAMWDTSKPNALSWLGRRGFKQETLITARIGVNLTNRRIDDGEEWGLAPSTRIWLPRGIIVPWFIDGELWKINIRRPGQDLRTDDDPKYVTVRGSANALYGADTLQARRPAFLVEGVFDALAIHQEAGDLAGAVATGTTGAREIRWFWLLQRCSDLLAAHDDDGPEKGDKASNYWISLLPRLAARWRPFLKDTAEMLEKGVSVRAWVEQGLETRRAA